jgi:hypothetical protein
MDVDNAQLGDQIAAPALSGGNDHVEGVIRRAEQELRQLIAERATLTKRIGTVKQTLAGLANLFGDGVLNADLSEFAARNTGLRQPGITQACRRVLLGARRPMGVLDVCNEIQRTLPALLARHKDPMATVSTILSRLVEYGQATVSSGDRGSRLWSWVPEHDSGSSHTSGENGSSPVA